MTLAGISARLEVHLGAEDAASQRLDRGSGEDRLFEEMGY